MNQGVAILEISALGAALLVLDAAEKAAHVKLLQTELNDYYGYITVLIRGDVVAVRAAVDAGQEKVEGLGKLIAAHVIPRPSPGILSLLPQ